MAIDRNQINEIRNNGAYRDRRRAVRHQGHRLHEEPGLPEVRPQAGEEAGVRRTRPRTAVSSASCSSTPTTPPTRKRPRSSRSSSPRPASTPRSSRTTRPRSSSLRSAATSASCCGATTPVTIPTRSTSGGQHRIHRSTSASSTTRRCRALIDQGRTETDAAKRKQIYHRRQQALRVAGLQRVGLLRRLGGGRQEDRAGSRRGLRSPTVAASRRCSSTAANPCSVCT